MGKKRFGLKRELSLFSVTIAGVGIILGAGIYALIGVAAGVAGNALWLSFLISSLVAVFTGFSYAEISSMFRDDAGEYEYVEKAFNKKLAFTVGLMIIFAGIVSASTVALAFAGYFLTLVNIPFIFASILIVILMTLINFIGIKESSWFNTLSTFVEFLGLFIIIVLGLKHIGSVNYFEMPYGFSGVLRASALVFFAYMGFESIVKLTEETKNAKEIIPKSLIYSLLITSVIYVLVAISAVSILNWQKLASSSSPLSDVAVSSLGPMAVILIGIIALFSTSNTILITLVTTSRLLYGMAKKKVLPYSLALVHKKTRTPWLSVIVLMVITIIFNLIGDIEIVANITNLFLFLTFAFVNLSVIILRYKDGETKRYFKMPLNIGKFPLLALLGFITSFLLFVFVIWNLILI